MGVRKRWAWTVSHGQLTGPLGPTLAMLLHRAMKALEGAVQPDPYLYVPAAAGVPTAVPPAVTGMVAMQYNTTTGVLYAYNGGAWVVV